MNFVCNSDFSIRKPFSNWKPLILLRETILGLKSNHRVPSNSKVSSGILNSVMFLINNPALGYCLSGKWGTEGDFVHRH
jgi:hypothetical protein